jgi:predicted transcriptional regulator
MKVLLSIKPQFAESILDGTKRYEFRRRIYQDERVESVVIYATLPVGKVIGEFSIKKIHEAKPTDLWKKTREFAGISKKFFNEYFSDREVGYAIEVDHAVRYNRPRELSTFLPSGIAPQSFAYVREGI